jgi:hypothetical protein
VAWFCSPNSLSAAAGIYVFKVFSTFPFHFTKKFLGYSTGKFPVLFPRYLMMENGLKSPNYTEKNMLLGAAQGVTRENQIYTELETSALTFSIAEILP